MQKENHWSQQKGVFWKGSSVDGALLSELVLNLWTGKCEKLEIGTHTKVPHTGTPD